MNRKRKAVDQTALLAAVQSDVNSSSTNTFLIKFAEGVKQQIVRGYAEHLYNLHPNISSAKTWTNYAVVDVKKSVNVSAFKKKLAHELVDKIIAAGRKALYGLTTAEWDYSVQRCIVIKEPVLKDGHVSIFENGRYQQRPVESYMTRNMLSRMASNSKKRGHGFDPVIAKQKLTKAFEAAALNDFKCGCKHPRCSVTMTLFGQHALSPDRGNDSLSYTDSAQLITLVAKEHNTCVKHDSTPRIRKSQKSWVGRTASSMAKHTCDRVNMLRSKGDHMSEQELQQVQRFDREESTGFARYTHLKSLLELKQQASTVCRDCKRDLHFGDCDGILRLCNVGHQASPDRIDNANIFYDADNFDLVCISCNLTENRGGRTHVEHTTSKQSIALTLSRMQECLKWLN
jgi:hypothetical protein